LGHVTDRELVETGQGARLVGRCEGASGPRTQDRRTPPKFSPRACRPPADVLSK